MFIYDVNKFTVARSLRLLLFLTSSVSVTVVQGAYFRRQRNCPGLVLTSDKCPDTVQNQTRPRCAASCLQQQDCVSFLWDSKISTCRLCVSKVSSDCNSTQTAGFLMAYEKNTCQNGATAALNNTCICVVGFYGLFCEKRMTDCNDWKASGFIQDGVYWVLPVLATSAFKVRCLMQWTRTYFMLRDTKTLNFYRNWTEYVNGFGSLSGDHWLGLRQVFLLTNSFKYTMIAEVKLKNYTYFQQWHTNFVISDERNFFRLSFTTSFTPSTLLSPGDCLGSVQGKPFSAFDVDNDDDDTGNCAERHQAGWWFGNCTLCNPTGPLLQPANSLRSGVPAEAFWTPNLGNLAPNYVHLWFQRT